MWLRYFEMERRQKIDSSPGCSPSWGHDPYDLRQIASILYNFLLFGTIQYALDVLIQFVIFTFITFKWNLYDLWKIAEILYSVRLCGTFQYTHSHCKVVDKLQPGESIKFHCNILELNCSKKCSVLGLSHHILVKSESTILHFILV